MTGSTTQIPAAKSWPAVLDVGVAPGAGSVAHVSAVMRIFSAMDLCAGREGVELGVDALMLAAKDVRDLSLPVGGEVLAGPLDLFYHVEHRSVVDSDRVRVLVLDDRSVHECAEVLERLVVQVAGGDPLRDRVGQLRCDLVHVGEAVGHRDGDLLAGRALGDAGPDLRGESELAAKVVRPLGGDAEVGADGGDPVGLAGMRRGAAQQDRRNCSCWVDEAELLALVGLRLDAADLIRARCVGRAAARSGRGSVSGPPYPSLTGELRGWPWRRGSGAGRRR